MIAVPYHVVAPAARPARQPRRTSPHQAHRRGSFRQARESREQVTDQRFPCSRRVVPTQSQPNWAACSPLAICPRQPSKEHRSWRPFQSTGPTVDRRSNRAVASIAIIGTGRLNSLNSASLGDVNELPGRVHFQRPMINCPGIDGEQHRYVPDFPDDTDSSVPQRCMTIAAIRPDPWEIGA